MIPILKLCFTAKKYLLLSGCILFYVFSGFVADAQDEPYKNGEYYQITSDNFIILSEKNGDTIRFTTLRPFDNYKRHSWDNITYIKRTSQRGGITYYYCDSRDTGKNSRYVIFSVMIDGDLLMKCIDTQYYKTLEECLNNNPILIPNNFLYFTLYSGKNLKKFSTYRRLTTINNDEACLLINKLKTELNKNKSQIQNNARFDIYLTASTKEIVNRVLIDMKINPLLYTDEEFNKTARRCKIKTSE